jgi:DNA polymerase
MDKQAELTKLEIEMVADASLPLREANLVFGEGNVDCDVMFVGEAPGQNEDRLKRPFVGRGGQLLDRMIASIGWKRADVYITNIVKRRPPENRDPSPDEIAAYRPYLTRQIEVIDPKVVVTLGRFAMNYFLPMAKITRDRGRGFLVGGRIIFPVLHPAAALRSTEMMKALEEDFKKLPSAVRGDIEASSRAPTRDPVVIAPAREAKKTEKQKQGKLF